MNGNPLQNETRAERGVAFTDQDSESSVGTGAVGVITVAAATEHSTSVTITTEIKPDSRASPNVQFLHK
jgi:hypothetical protein